MSDVDPISPDDCEEELRQALLAAFGDDAMELQDDDDFPETPNELQSALTPNANPTTPCCEDQVAVQSETFSHKLASNNNDTPRSRWVKELYRAIYASRDSLPSPAIHPEEAGPHSLAARYVVFVIGDQQFAIPLRDVREIARKSKITELPGTPSWLYGVTNLRGQILSVTDLRNLLHISSARPTVGEKIIVIHSQQNSLTTSIVVDRVIGIRSGGKALKDTQDLSHSIASRGDRESQPSRADRLC